jgi:hypothetical protein
VNDRLKRADVEVLYNLLVEKPHDLPSLTHQASQYAPEQVRWALGTLVVQGIVRAPVERHMRSDKRQGEPVLEVVLSFDGYIDYEQAK